jgi:hypothetical protein
MQKSEKGKEAKQGKALEYCIANQFVSKLKTNYILEKHVGFDESQARDKLHFKSLPIRTRDCFQKASERLYSWFIQNSEIQQGNSVYIQRMTDHDGIKGDVTDLKIGLQDEIEFNFSIKHNHKASKHQRPGATASNQFAYGPKSTEDCLFKDEYLKIHKRFREKVKEKFPEVNTFQQLKKLDPDFFLLNLYNPVCLLVTDFINRHSEDTYRIGKYFFFIQGSTNEFYKFLVKSKKKKNVVEAVLELQHFIKVEKPRSVRAVPKNNKHIEIQFSNGWVFNLRLHHDRGDIFRGKTIPMKFDTQLLEPEIEIIYSANI